MSITIRFCEKYSHPMVNFGPDIRACPQCKIIHLDAPVSPEDEQFKQAVFLVGTTRVEETR